MVKYFINLAFFVLCTSGICFSQPDPITIQFVEAQPLWEHLTWDTTFYDIGNQPGINKYNVVVPHQCYRFNNDLIISSYCLNHRAEFYGYILEQIDINSGQVRWQNYSTYYNNGFQDHYKNMYLRDDGNLEMIGIKRHGEYLDTLFSYWNIGGGQSNYVRKVFDYNTGDLINTVEGKDSIRNIAPSYQVFYPIKIDSAYLVLHQTGKEVDGTIRYGYDFYTLNEYHNLTDTLPISTVFFETTDSVSFWSYGQPPFIKKLNDSTLVCLLFQDRFYPEKTKAQLIWIDIKDYNNIKVLKRIQVEDLIQGDASSFLYFNFNIVNEKIYITQPYYNNELEDHTAFFVVLDRNGEILHNLTNCVDDFHVYETFSLIYSSDSYDYVAAFQSKTGREGFDILRINSGSDSLHYISSLTSAIADEEFTRQMEVSNLFEDGIFIIGAYTKKFGGEENSAVKYYGFDGQSLGMQVQTNVEVTPIEVDFNIFPNPTNGNISIDFKQDFTGDISVYDILGRKLKSFSLLAQSYYQFDISSESSGLYFITVFDQQYKYSHSKTILLLQ